MLKNIIMLALTVVIFVANVAIAHAGYGYPRTYTWRVTTLAGCSSDSSCNILKAGNSAIRATKCARRDDRLPSKFCWVEEGVCDDNNWGTVDVFNPESGYCESTTKYWSCPAPDYSSLVCPKGTFVISSPKNGLTEPGCYECFTDEDCSDGDACTAEVCAAGMCNRHSITDGLTQDGMCVGSKSTLVGAYYCGNVVGRPQTKTLNGGRFLNTGVVLSQHQAQNCAEGELCDHGACVVKNRRCSTDDDCMAPINGRWCEELAPGYWVYSTYQDGSAPYAGCQGGWCNHIESQTQCGEGDKTSSEMGCLCQDMADTP